MSSAPALRDSISHGKEPSVPRQAEHLFFVSTMQAARLGEGSGMNRKVLVACIGNVFLGDDGFGSEVAQLLSSCDAGDDVKVVDYGIRTIELAYALLEPWEAVILVDAVQRDGPPGTLYLLRPGDAVTAVCSVSLDQRTISPAQVMAAARSLGPLRTDVYLLGCQPLQFGDDHCGGMRLSAPVAHAIPKAAELVRALALRLAQSAVPAAA
jgi:hydrogenase maturation protease